MTKFLLRLLLNAVLYTGIGVAPIFLITRGVTLTQLLLVAVVLLIAAALTPKAEWKGVIPKIVFFYVSACSLPFLLVPVWSYAMYIDVHSGNLQASFLVAMALYVVACLATFTFYISYLETYANVTIRAAIAWYIITVIAAYIGLLVLILLHDVVNVDQQLLFMSWRWAFAVIYLVAAASVFTCGVSWKRRRKKRLHITYA